MTLAETVVSLAIVGGLLAASIGMLGAATAAQRHVRERSIGEALAAELMYEILEQPYMDADDEAGGFGPDAAEQATGNRSLFDDVNDYDGWSASPPQSKSGSPRSDLPGWSRSVTVTGVNPAALDALAPSNPTACRVDVVVSYDGIEVARLTAVRTAGLAEALGCCFADESCQNVSEAECLSLGGEPMAKGWNCWSDECKLLPVAHWTMDDAAGLIATDDEGGHDGALLNGPVWISGRVDGALEFDGVDDYVEVPHSEALSIAGKITLCAWIRKSSNSGWDVVLSKGTTGNNHSYAIQAFNSQIAFSYNDGTNRDHFVSFIMLRNTWYHVAATFDETTDSVKFYINGTLRQSFTSTGTLKANTEPLRIGRCVDAYYWHGMIDDVRVYDRVLTGEQIANIHAGLEP